MPETHFLSVFRASHPGPPGGRGKVQFGAHTWLFNAVCCCGRVGDEIGSSCARAVFVRRRHAAMSIRLLRWTSPSLSFQFLSLRPRLRNGEGGANLSSIPPFPLTTALIWAGCCRRERERGRQACRGQSRSNLLINLRGKPRLLRNESPTLVKKHTAITLLPSSSFPLSSSSRSRVFASTKEGVGFIDSGIT